MTETTELCQCGHEKYAHIISEGKCTYYIYEEGEQVVRSGCPCPRFTPPVDEREKAIDEWAIHAALVDLHFQTDSVRKCAAINDLLERAKRDRFHHNREVERLKDAPTSSKFSDPVTDYKARLLERLDALPPLFTPKQRDALNQVRKIIEQL